MPRPGLLAVYLQSPGFLNYNVYSTAGDTEPAGRRPDGRRTVTPSIRNVATVCTVLILAGCGLPADPQMLKPAFWTNSPLKADNVEAELGIAELAKGNFVLAESHFDKALKANPNDVHALLGRATLYHHTGQTTRARAMYEAVLALRPSETEQLMVMNNFTTRPVSEIASVNLSLLQSGNVTGRLDPAAMGGEVETMGPAAGGAMPLHGDGMGAASDSDANVMSRFETLKALRDQGLITPDEYAARRKANVGALLPLTSSPPAAGLERPVPTTDQVLGRLRAIGRALEMRAMTVGQHASERKMILDGLLPETPPVTAVPMPPPRGLMAAADLVRRLEMLNEAQLISSDEVTRERTAIGSGLQQRPGAPRAAGADSRAMMAPGGGPQPAVHIASYRSERAARRGWTQLKRAHAALLGSLEPEITRVNLGAGKGVYYRLKAGPLNSQGAAQALCRQLKARRQYCESSFIEG